MLRELFHFTCYPNTVPKFKRDINQLKTTEGQQNIPLSCFKDCRSPEDTEGWTSLEVSGHSKSAAGSHQLWAGSHSQCWCRRGWWRPVDAGIEGDGGEQGPMPIPPLKLSTQFPSRLRELAVIAISLLSSWALRKAQICLRSEATENTAGESRGVWGENGDEL